MAGELTGRIQDISVRSLLTWVRHSRKTGTLSFRNSVHQGWIEFRNGEIVSARSSVAYEDLGTILLNNKIITHEQLAEGALEQRDADNPLPLGRTLITLGYASVKDVREAMRKQVDQVIQDLLTLGEGVFEFEAKCTYADNITQNVSDVLMAVDTRMITERRP